MAERTRGGCAALALAGAELAALALIFLAWGGSYFSWDPQSIGDPVGPYVAKAGVVAVFAAVAAVVAAGLRAGAMVRSQVAVVVLSIAVMVGANAAGTSAERERRWQACHAGLAADWCADLR
ncbi:DUF6234 family protein [Streptomyces olivoreticuli]